MIYVTSPLAVAVFIGFVVGVLTLSWWLGRRARSSSGYYAAHGQIHWFVNGIAFAGDYLSAASFLGICGMIAFYGYDGFLYAIGYLAGWIVALFVVAEPPKRLGRYTFADALDARFHSRGIKLAAAISTLVVSLFYLIPQMVGAGVLIQPLLGFSHASGVPVVGIVVPTIVVTAGTVSTPGAQLLSGGLLAAPCLLLTAVLLQRGHGAHASGVLIVGIVVTIIVVTAGMVSTTWVQFIKGGLLVAFCLLLTVMILQRGYRVPDALAVTPVAADEAAREGRVLSDPEWPDDA